MLPFCSSAWLLPSWICALQLCSQPDQMAWWEIHTSISIKGYLSKNIFTVFFITFFFHSSQKLRLTRTPMPPFLLKRDQSEEKKIPKGVPLQFDINSVGKQVNAVSFLNCGSSFKKSQWARRFPPRLTSDRKRELVTTSCFYFQFFHLLYNFKQVTKLTVPVSLVHVLHAHML